jgi:hypothetical protein
VIAINAESKDMQEAMNLVWENILPHLGEAPLPPNEIQQQLLVEKLDSLKLPVLQILGDAPLADKISGDQYILQENEDGVDSVSIEFKNSICNIVLAKGQNSQTITCGKEKWIVEQNQLDAPHTLFPYQNRKKIPSKVAASYSWKDDDLLLIQLKYIEDIHGDIWEFYFEADNLEVWFSGSLAKLQNREDERKKWVGKKK